MYLLVLLFLITFPTVQERSVGVKYVAHVSVFLSQINIYEYGDVCQILYPFPLLVFFHFF